MGYKYGMRLRDFSIGCQPMEGLCEVHDGYHPKYWSILIYNRKLSDKEVSDYELDYLGAVNDMGEVVDEQDYRRQAVQY